MKNDKMAFTLAETMIVVVVLGLVASITIPAVVKRQKEMAERTKIKKDMTVYDHAVSKMVVENGIKNEEALISYAGDEDNDCLNSTTYFNKASGDGCKFKTPDGVWWDISDITNPKIAFKEDDLSEETAVDMKKKFELFAWFDNNGSLRVDDLEASTGDAKGNLAMLYDYLAGKKVASSDGKNLNCDDDDYGCKYKRGDEFPSCSTEYGSEPCLLKDGSTLIITSSFGTTLYHNGEKIIEANSLDIDESGNIESTYGAVIFYKNGEKKVVFDSAGIIDYDSTGKPISMSYGRIEYLNGEEVNIECNSSEECALILSQINW